MNFLSNFKSSKEIVKNRFVLRSNTTVNFTKVATSQKLIQLLEANVHFGHSVNSWNSKMFSYIYNEKNGLHIIDLIQTAELLEEACEFLYKAGLDKRTVLFVGTKPEAANIIANEALKSNSHYINYRWLGGMLTNWNTIRSRITRLKILEQKKSEDTFDKVSNKESSVLINELEKLRSIFNGIKNMENIPDVMIVVDQHIETTAIQEAKILNIPIISIVDTNCDPELIDLPIPGNDDSILSIQFILSKLSDSIICGYEDSTKQ
jgi:small subunit ribosomal protein S2